jgi:hypothetical protein
MDLSNGVQIASGAAVALALLFNASQAREGARQTKSLRASLRQGTYLALVHARGLYEVLLDRPDLLRAHLSSRGLPVTSTRANRRRLYALMKLDIHEGSFLSHRDGLLDAQLWEALCRAMMNDFRSPEIKRVWPKVSGFYAPEFGEFADRDLSGGSAQLRVTWRRRAGGWVGRLRRTR